MLCREHMQRLPLPSDPLDASVAGVDLGGPDDLDDDQGMAALLAILQRRGVRAAGIARLLALLLAWQGHDPALDGFVPDPRASFVRWLYQRGRIAG
jgi:hypothetical protein